MKKLIRTLWWDVKDFGLLKALGLWTGFIYRKVTTGKWYVR